MNKQAKWFLYQIQEILLNLLRVFDHFLLIQNPLGAYYRRRLKKQNFSQNHDPTRLNFLNMVLTLASFASGCLFPSIAMEIQIPEHFSEKDKVIYHRMVITRVTESLLGHGIFPKDIIDVITGFEDSLLRNIIQFNFVSPEDLNTEITKYNDSSFSTRLDQIKFKKNNIDYISGFYTKDHKVAAIDCLWNVQYHPNINNDYSFCALYRMNSSQYVALNDVYLFVHPVDYTGNLLDLSQYSCRLCIREEAKNKNYKSIKYPFGKGQAIYEVTADNPSELVLLPEDVICLLQRK